jgi:hypothetical protein
MFLSSQLLELKQALAHFAEKKDRVSTVSVGWHIDHSLIVIRDVMQQVIQSDPKKYAWTFNIGRLIILTT